MIINNNSDFIPGGMFDWINDPKFNPGGFQDRIDTRDFQFDEVAGASVIPFDWNQGIDIETELSTRLSIPNFKLPVKNQGLSFSCGGQSWANYAGVLEAFATGTFEERSAKFLYSQTYVPGGGSRGRDNADIFVNQGAARENILTSYQATKPPTEVFMERSGDITDSVRIDAKLSKAIAYAQTGTDINSVAMAIRDNMGVVIGVDGQNNGSWVSTFPIPPTTVQWRHWLYCCGAKLIGGKKYIKILNSWGKDVGDGGFQYLSEDYFNSHVWSGWTHVFAPLPVVNFAHVFNIDIKMGDMGQEVIALQKVLQMKDFFPSTVPTSGLYGKITKSAVLKFQIANNIFNTSGAIVGPSTRKALNRI